MALFIILLLIFVKGKNISYSLLILRKIFINNIALATFYLLKILVLQIHVDEIIFIIYT